LDFPEIRKKNLRFLPLAPETIQLLDHYLRLERPNPSTAALFVLLKGPARGARMTPAGLRSLFRYHRVSCAAMLLAVAVAFPVTNKVLGI